MKNIVITGSTRGIGKGLAQAFLRRGHRVIINGTTQSSVDSALDELRKAYGKSVCGYPASSSEYQAMEALYDFAVASFGQVDIWINNAGIDQTGKLFYEMPIENVQKVISTNVIGVMNGSHVAARRMLSQGFGQIYNMQGLGSNGMILPKSIIYGTSKRAVSYFTKGLAKEMEGTSVQIGRLSPGMVLTDLIRNSITEDDEKRSEDLKKIFNILGNEVGPVAAHLVEQILNNHKNGIEIKYLSGAKTSWRFVTSGFSRRKLL